VLGVGEDCACGDGVLCVLHGSKVISFSKPASTIFAKQPKRLPNYTKYLPNRTKNVIKELHAVKIHLR
jgi:hypothetical protein